VVKCVPISDTHNLVSDANLESLYSYMKFKICFWIVLYDLNYKQILDKTN